MGIFRKSQEASRFNIDHKGANSVIFWNKGGGLRLKYIQGFQQKISCQNYLVISPHLNGYVRVTPLLILKSD